MTMEMKLTISAGNSKLGKIPNLSLPPGTTCRPGAPCFGDGCYALKAWRMFPSVRKAWDGNLALWQEQPVRFEQDLSDWLYAGAPEFFRWHVGGDVPDNKYFRMMLRQAYAFPDIKFLAFSKRWDIIPVAPKLPANFSLIFSAWPKLPRPPAYPPVAWLSEDPRKPQEYFKCRGNCSQGCHRCWDAGKLGIDIVFDRH